MAAKMNTSEITAALAGLDGWESRGESAIHKDYRFADHIEAMGFVNRVAMAAEKMDHHPELTIVYNNVSINLNTHDAGGVTDKDIELAKTIERYR